MIFHIITSNLENKQLASLCAAAKVRSIEVNVVDASSVLFKDLKSVKPEDIFLRVGVSDRARVIEKYLFNPKAGHIFESNITGVLSTAVDAYYPNLRDNLPVIKTVPFVPINMEDLDFVVDYLGGFPVIVKVNGSQNGVGVMKIDSKSSLNSVLDFLKSLGGDVWLREYVPHKHQARLVVVGDKVVGSMNNFPVGDDFRTNVNTTENRNYVSAAFSLEMQTAAVKAVHSVGRYFGGVDLLIKDDGTYFIAEVNTPCGFSKTEEVEGSDIAGSIVDFLVDRSRL